MQAMNPIQPSSSDSAPRGGVWRGVIAGLVPLAPVVLIIVVALGLSALARQVTAGLGFAAQQWAAVIIIALGLIGAAIAYVVFCRRALRAVRRWQEAGAAAQANGALWGLVVVALIVLLPLLLAFFMPQHPAPNLAP